MPPSSEVGSLGGLVEPGSTSGVGAVIEGSTDLQLAELGDGLLLQVRRERGVVLVGRQLLAVGEHVEPVAVLEPEIDDHRVDALAREDGDAAVPRQLGRDPVAVLAEELVTTGRLPGLDNQDGTGDRDLDGTQNDEMTGSAG